jgi:hypothetical protein
MGHRRKKKDSPIRFFFVLDSSELTHTSFLVIFEAIMVNRGLVVQQTGTF